MAKLYGEIAAKSLLTLDKSFARANGQPLDASEVYYSLEAAKTYAAGAQAYIGQKIVVIENGAITHYSVEDTSGTLKELGSKPVGDGLTITVADDGKISLANIPEVQKDDEGNDIPATYNAVLVNGKLTWVKPSATTVEGLSDLIEALTGRVDDAEADIDALQASVGVAAKEAVGEEGSEGYEPAVAATGLHKAIADEIARATAAEEALGGRIDAIDFVSETELGTALEPYAKSADVVANSTYATDKKALEDGIAAKIDASTYATDKKALEDEDAAIRAIAEGARDSINAFLTSEEVDETVNTLKEIQAEIDKMTDATELATALSAKADKSYVDEELGKKQDVIAENTYDAYGSAATAKSEAIADAEGKIATAKQEAIDAAAGDATTKANQALADAKADAADLYATKAYVGTIPTDEKYADVTNVISYINKKAEETLTAANGGSSETAASVAQALDTFKSEINPKVTKNTEDITTINDKLKNIEDNADVNIIEAVKVNGVALTPDENKAVNITVPTKFSEITDDSGFDTRITAAQTQADKGVNDASAAQTTANEAKAAAEANATALGTLNTTVAGHTTSINDHASRLTVLENANTAHKSEYDTLKSIVDGHTTTIASKAEQTALDAAIARIATNETTIGTLNSTVLPGIIGDVAKKANSADVYTKTQIGTLAKDGEGNDKTIVQMIEDAKAAAITGATYDDTAVKADIKKNSDALAVLVGTKEGDNTKTVREIAADEINTIIDGVNDTDTIINITSLIEYVNANGDEVTGIQKDIDSLQAIVAGIGGENQPATVAALVEQEIAAIPLATLVKGEGDVVTATKGLILPESKKFEMTDGKVTAVSTDLLTQGSATLVLNGGSATL